MSRARPIGVLVVDDDFRVAALHADLVERIDGFRVVGSAHTGPHPDVIAITAARDLPSIRTAMQRGVVQYLVKPFPFRTLVERLFGLMRSAGGTSQLPKGLSEPTMALVRAQFAGPEAEFSAAEIAERIGVSRATAQRYLSLLVRADELELSLRYGTAGRPEHRYHRTPG